MIERVAISSIHVGERRRQDLGDISSLAKNIDAHGLIHPIVISSDNELIAGERRLRAHQHLGLDTIEVRRWAVLDPAEQREIELAENLDRKDLTTIERSRNLVALADVAAGVDRAQAEENPCEARTGSRGPAPTPGSLRRVAERTGVPVKTIHDARQHVAAVDAYPELAAYPQVDAVKIAGRLNALPDDERVETRAAVMAHNGHVLAELTGRPPMPSGPSPREQAAKDPAVRFQTDLHDLWKRLNGVRDHGGIALVIADWAADRKVGLMGEVELIAELMNEWQAAIKESIS